MPTRPQIEHDAEYAMFIKREVVPYSNIHKLTIDIESFRLPDDFLYEVANLIGKYKCQVDQK